MTTLRPRQVAGAAVLSVCCGCAGPVLDARPSPAATGTATAVAPRPAVERVVSGFSPALRCMDDQLHRFGIRDVAIVLEDIADKTSRTNAGTRDMMVTAVSDMTRRSRAIKLITFGSDNSNVVSFLQTTGRSNLFSIVPQYALRGAVTQFDDELVRRTVQAGFSIPQLFGFRGSSSTQFSAIGFDASVVTTEDLALVAGTATRNSVVIARQETSASDGVAQLAKLGVTFSVAVNRNDSIAQGVRSMIELAAVELVGKLLKLPYWKCLQVETDSADIGREVEDWFASFTEAERTSYYQEHLRNRKFWDGAVDGQPGPALAAALGDYAAAIGRRGDDVASVGFFRAFLEAPVPRAPAAPAKEATTFVPRSQRTADAARDAAGGTDAGATADSTGSTAETSTEPRGDGGPELRISPNLVRLRAGQPFELEISPTADAYVYCYRIGADGKVQRIFPNRFARDPRIAAGTVLRLPGSGRFRLQAPRGSAQAEGACLSAAREVYNDLPPPLRWGDFEDIGLSDPEAIRQGFEQAAGTPVRLTRFRIPVVRD